MHGPAAILQPIPVRFDAKALPDGTRRARLSQTALGAKESGQPGDRLALELPPRSSIA